MIIVISMIVWEVSLLVVLLRALVLLVLLVLLLILSLRAVQRQVIGGKVVEILLLILL